MSIWGDIKNAASGVVDGAVAEVRAYGDSLVSNIWAGSSPATEQKQNAAEVVASIPNAGDDTKAGTGALVYSSVNWQAVAAIAAAAAVVVMLVRGR